MPLAPPVRIDMDLATGGGLQGRTARVQSEDAARTAILVISLCLLHIVRYKRDLAVRRYFRPIASIKAAGSIMGPRGTSFPERLSRIVRPVFKADSQNRSGVIFGSTWQARA